MIAADCDRFFNHPMPAENTEPAQPPGSFAEQALNEYYDRETALVQDFIKWQQATSTEPVSLFKFNMAVTGEVVAGGVCAVLRHAQGGSLSSGPVMLNMNDPDPYQTAYREAIKMLLVVVR
jgi:hypothetical protein